MNQIESVSAELDAVDEELETEAHVATAPAAPVVPDAAAAAASDASAATDEAPPPA